MPVTMWSGRTQRTFALNKSRVLLRAFKNMATAVRASDFLPNHKSKQFLKEYHLRNTPCSQWIIKGFWQVMSHVIKKSLHSPLLDLASSCRPEMILSSCSRLKSSCKARALLVPTHCSQLKCITSLCCSILLLLPGDQQRTSYYKSQYQL